MPSKKTIIQFNILSVIGGVIYSWIAYQFWHDSSNRGFSSFVMMVINMAVAIPLFSIPMLIFVFNYFSNAAQKQHEADLAYQRANRERKKVRKKKRR